MESAEVYLSEIRKLWERKQELIRHNEEKQKEICEMFNQIRTSKNKFIAEMHTILEPFNIHPERSLFDAIPRPYNSNQLKIGKYQIMDNVISRHPDFYMRVFNSSETEECYFLFMNKFKTEMGNIQKVQNEIRSKIFSEAKKNLEEEIKNLEK